MVMKNFEDKLTELYNQRNRLRRQKQRHMLEYVVDNTYFHDVRVETVVPEVQRFMTENFDPTGTTVVSMFRLKALTLMEGSAASQAFTFNFNEDEVVSWFREMDLYYQEVEDKYQQDWANYVAKVNAAAIEYQAGVDRVNHIYETILENAKEDAELYWDMHFDMPEGMEHDHL